MSYEEKIKREIIAKIDELRRQHRSLHASWITHRVCQDHVSGLADNDHADFWRWGGYRAAREYTTRCINQLEHGNKDLDLKQQTFPGFDHLQTYYVVERQGGLVGVPTEFLTDEEIDVKAAMHRAMGEANFAHADELIRYKAWRRDAGTGQ